MNSICPLLLSAICGAALAPAASAKPIVIKPIPGLYYMPSGSMEPTLPIGARLWASPVPYQKADPKRGDIALLDVATSVARFGVPKGATVWAKRIVAVPGDRVEMANGVLKLNGQVQKEPYVLWRAASPGLPTPNEDRYDLKVVHGAVFSRDRDAKGVVGGWTRGDSLVAPDEQAVISNAKTEPLPPHKYLALGDHRSNSLDSHVFGLVDRSQIKAKVTMRIYPRIVTF